ncbi:MAG: hypothetical protein IT561_26110 [Alphaproteobacteria bacterium]|nr:hypothetical protein [Alphaproteobacteria bacterium]
MWHGGYWNHSWRDGRLGWWWVADGYWYPYAEPIYPYPAYPYPAYPYPTYVPPPAPIIAPPPGPPPAQTWYACDDPQGYYPYVTQCNVPWRQVPVTPPK